MDRRACCTRAAFPHRLEGLNPPCEYTPPPRTRPRHMKQITYSIASGTFSIVESLAIAQSMIACGNPYGHDRGCAATPQNLAKAKAQGLREVASEDSPLDSLLGGLTENEVVTTREVASGLKISTAQAYKLLSAAEQAKKVCKYGYRAKGGWEYSAHSNRKCDSLGWQVIK